MLTPADIARAYGMSEITVQANVDSNRDVAGVAADMGCTLDQAQAIVGLRKKKSPAKKAAATVKKVARRGK